MLSPPWPGSSITTGGAEISSSPEVTMAVRLSPSQVRVHPSASASARRGTMVEPFSLMYASTARGAPSTITVTPFSLAPAAVRHRTSASPAPGRSAESIFCAFIDIPFQFLPDFSLFLPLQCHYSGFFALMASGKS